jgi:alpha-ribazole phosphatase
MRNRAENQIGMVFIRHGETDSNRRKSYLGWTDEPLSVEGREVIAQNRKKYPDADFIFTSPMLRCRQTKEIIYGDQFCQIIEKWKEMNFGSFEGKTYLELNGNKDYQRWIDSGGTLPFPEGESREEFILRCRAGLMDCLTRLTEKRICFTEQENEPKKASQQKKVQGKVVCVVHGGTIMALFDSYGKGSYFDYQCRCGQGYECTLSYTTDENGAVDETSIFITDEKLILGE